MAYIEGYPGGKTGSSAEMHIGLTIVVAIVFIGFMLFSADNWRAELPTILGLTAAIAALILFASYRVNPMGWRRLFRRSAYDHMMHYDRMVAEELDQLDDNYFIFHDLTFELFHIENLVISTRGIFIVAKIREAEELHVENNILYAGETPLDTLTGNLWRICHLINIVYKKAYREDVMPKPFLVAPEAARVAIDNFEDITILPLKNLRETMEKDKKEVMKLEIAQSFAFYIKKRYI
ncbi:MAG: NERD domain-containing protein [Deltaproteobacteria bacterium]|nr:NERD domain-containing protein [Deltaproteobacteria bacterium]